MEESIKAIFDSLGNLITTGGLRLLGAIIVLIVGSKLIKWVIKLINRNKRFTELQPNVKALITDAIKVVLYVLLAVTIASMLGIEMTSIVAAIASLGLAVGLALQGSLSNLAGGVMILVFHPFSIGDFIDNGAHSGTVTDIGVFYTTLQTLDNKNVTIPNGALSNSSVVDFSTNKLRRVDIPISVGYESDIETVKKVLSDTALAHEKVLKDPAPFVRLGEHGNSALVFYLRVWAENADYWDVYFDLMENTKKELDKNGISIPFPQMDVHLDK